ncbi:MAG: arylamine N-acetyltransferase, partial [Muribaculaceae bacterium]|nr:arylamine N-acetyltransferase [Muribaculaceae bacterium]
SSRITISWNKNSKADGYEIYYYKKKAGKKNFHTSYSSEGAVAYTESPESLKKAEQQEFKKLKTTTETSYAIKRDKNYSYYFKIRAYQNKDGKKVYGDFSGVSSTTSSVSLFNGAKGKSKSTVPVISYRSDVSEWTMNISAADKKTISDFMKKHFTSGMSDYDKAVYLADYIHYNVDYASAEGLNKISNLSCVQAAITNKTGQCYQYNGALAEFLAYMGYDVRLVCGYRESQLTGNRISHYWCEITLDGVKYVLDAGNKKDGLYNFCLPYECTNGYVVP